MVPQNGEVNHNTGALEPYQTTDYSITSGGDSAQNMTLPTHEGDLLLPPGSSGQPDGRSYSTLPHNTSKHNSTSWRWVFSFVVIFFLGIFLGVAIQRSTSTDILDPAVRDQIRQEWEVLYANHSRRMDKMVEAWDVEVERQSQLRLENMAERKQWDAECQAREKVREEERMEEVERRRRERKKEEEEEERNRADVRWGELQRSDRCLRYGTRKYWSKLQSPEGYDALKGCRETEIEIHGRKLLPNFCNDQGTWSGVQGIWIVDFNEASCGTYWSDFWDEGCTAGGSGLRRIHGRLNNYDGADDWTEMCSSTPVKFNGLSFDAPLYCKNYGRGGIFGFWVIDDGACR